MPAKLYRVTLTDEEREDLTALVNKGKGVTRRLTRSRILLLADENETSPKWGSVRDAYKNRTFGMLLPSDVLNLLL